MKGMNFDKFAKEEAAITTDDEEEAEEENDEDGYEDVEDDHMEEEVDDEEEVEAPRSNGKQSSLVRYCRNMALCFHFTNKLF